MTKRKFEFRKLAAIAICLAGMTMFSGCDKGNDPDNSNNPANDKLIVRDRTGEGAVKGKPDTEVFELCGIMEFTIDPVYGVEHGFTYHYIAEPTEIDHSPYYDPILGYEWYYGHGGLTIYVDINYNTDFVETYPGTGVWSGINRTKADKYFWNKEKFFTVTGRIMEYLLDRYPTFEFETEIDYYPDVVLQGSDIFKTYTGRADYYDINGFEGSIRVTIEPAPATVLNDPDFMDNEFIQDIWNGDMFSSENWWATGVKITIKWLVQDIG